MDIFLLLFQNLIPLYALIAVGYAAGKFFDVDAKSLGALAIYIFMPVAVLGYIVKMDFKPVYIGLPILVYALTSILGLLWIRLGKRVYNDNRSILVAMCATWGNTGYFALPLVIALFPPEAVGVYMFMLVGSIFYESTLGCYIWMRGHFNVRQSVMKVLKFPSLYAVLIGLILNFKGIDFSGTAQTYWEYFRGAYIVVGMMIIGGALSKVKKLVIAPRFIALSFFGKFLVWPALAYSLILFDIHVTRIFDEISHQMFFIISLVPPGANIAAFATSLNIRPEKAATTILLGTIAALFTVPLALALSGLFN